MTESRENQTPPDATRGQQFTKGQQSSGELSPPRTTDAPPPPPPKKSK